MGEKGKLWERKASYGWGRGDRGEGGELLVRKVSYSRLQAWKVN